MLGDVVVQQPQVLINELLNLVLLIIRSFPETLHQHLLDKGGRELPHADVIVEEQVECSSLIGENVLVKDAVINLVQVWHKSLNKLARLP